MNDYNMLLRIDTINKPILNIDSTIIVSVQISNKFFIRRRCLKRVFG